MKREKIDILREEIKIPEVVVDAAEDAFAQIAQEVSMSQKSEVTKVKRKPGFKKKWFAIAMVAVLAIGTLSVGAATNFQWFKAYTDVLEISEEEKALIEKYSMGAGVGQSVTDNDITITLEEYICDRRAAFIIFSIEGIDAPAEGQRLHLGGDGSHAGHVTNGSSKYLGQDPDTGKLLYMESILTSSTGQMVSGYMFANFTSVEIWEEEGIYEPILSKEGQWDFKVKLEETKGTKTYTTDTPVKGEDASLKEVTISPISMEYVVEYSSDYYYSVVEAEKENDDIIWMDYVVDFYGFMMKDGSIERPSGGGGSQWRMIATSECSFGKVIDVEQIESLLFFSEDYNSDDGVTAEDFVEVPLTSLKEVTK